LPKLRALVNRDGTFSFNVMLSLSLRMTETEP
jgi:hypothetical protein